MTENEPLTSANRNTAVERKPALDGAWFEEADAYIGTKLIRHGRPRMPDPKQAVSLRLDPQVVAWFKRDGRGWQTRMNDALRRAAGL